MRNVDFISYLPPFMQKYKEPVEALKAEEPEFNIIWDAAEHVLYNHFISTTDEYGISRYEKMLKIYPAADDTLESRRSRVQSKWFNMIPYTWKILLSKLVVLCGDADFSITNNFGEGYTIFLDTDLELYGQVEELERLINTIIPENIVVISQNNIPCEIMGVVSLGGGICFINEFVLTNDSKEIYEIQSASAFGGSIVQTEMLKVSNDFNEVQKVNGTMNLGGGTVETAMLKITQDFNETLRTDGSANVASGTVRVDFVEIN